MNLASELVYSSAPTQPGWRAHYGDSNYLMRARGDRPRLLVPYSAFVLNLICQHTQAVGLSPLMRAKRDVSRHRTFNFGEFRNYPAASMPSYYPGTF